MNPETGRSLGLALAGATALSLAASACVADRSVRIGLIEPCILPAPFEDSTVNRQAGQLQNETSAAIAEFFQSFGQGESLKDSNLRFYDLTLRKASYLMYQTPGLAELEVCPKGKNKLVIHGREFDMSYPSDFVLGNTFIEALFQNSFNPVPDARIKDLENFVWLKDRVIFDVQGVPPILPPAELEKVARIFRALEFGGLKPPKVIRIDNKKQGGDGVMHIEYQPYSYSGFFAAAGVTRYIDSETHLSERLRSIATAPEDDISNFLRYYIYDGNFLRSRIAYEQSRGSPNYGRELATMYDETRNALGVEFAGNALPKKGSSEHKVDTVVEIDDYERPKDPFILLRDPSDLKPTPGSSVKDGDFVQILGGPYPRQYDDRARTAAVYFSIQKVVPRPDGVSFDAIGEIGDVSNEWLGITIGPITSRN